MKSLKTLTVLSILSMTIQGAAIAGDDGLGYQELHDGTTCPPCPPVAGTPYSEGGQYEDSAIIDEGTVSSVPETNGLGNSLNGRSTSSLASPPTSNRQTGSSSVEEDLLSLGLSRGGFATTNIAPAGSALGAAVSQNAGQIVSAVRPAISAGLLTSANIESPYIADRVFMSYSYYDSFNALNTVLTPDPVNLGVAPTVSTNRVNGFDLHRFDVGFEKSLFDGLASVYFRAPFLDTTGEEVPVAINGAGNINAGFKVVLLSDLSSGNIITGGFTVAAPTSRETTVVLAEQGGGGNPVFIPANGDFVQRIDTTFLQPWLAGQINTEFVFLQAFGGILIPTDDRVVTSFNGGLTAGLNLYESSCGTVTSITPFLSTQVLAAFDSEGTVIVTDPLNPGNALLQNTGTLIDFEDQVFLTPGSSFGLGKRTSFSAGATIPVVGPKAFDIGASCGLNIFF